MLDVADNLVLALNSMPESKAAEGDMKVLRDGVVMVEKILAKSLETHGVVKVELTSSACCSMR